MICSSLGRTIRVSHSCHMSVPEASVPLSTIRDPGRHSTLAGQNSQSSLTASITRPYKTLALFSINICRSDRVMYGNKVGIIVQKLSACRIVFVVVEMRAIFLALKQSKAFVIILTGFQPDVFHFCSSRVSFIDVKIK